MKINAYKRTVQGFEFEATDCQGRTVECSADFTYENRAHPKLDDEPAIHLSELDNFTGRWADTDYREIAPCDALMKELRQRVHDSDAIAEAELEALTYGSR